MVMSSEPFGTLSSSWLVSLHSERTRAAYSRDFDTFASWLSERHGGSPLDAESRDIERYRAERTEGGAAHASIARGMSALRSFFGYAVNAGALTHSPTVTSPPRPSVAVTNESGTGELHAGEVSLLVAASRSLGPRTAVLVGLLLFDGLRLAEVLSANVADVTIRPRRADITLTRPAGMRTFRVDQWTAAGLRQYVESRHGGPLLLGESPTRYRERLTRFGADYLLKHAGAQAQLSSPLTANALRRSYVARSHARGVSLEDIRERLGHADVRTTRRHLTLDGS